MRASRKRRIKCDEGKPSCLKCSSTGRKCDGYESFKPSSRDAPFRLAFTPPTAVRASESEREIRAFQFFYERTVPQLAGYSCSEFWSRFVLQVSRNEKSIWHALTALGSIHENFENNQQLPGLCFHRLDQDSFAVQEYVTAIKSLLQPVESLQDDAPRSITSRPSVEVYLISCVLFACFEILSSHYISAINHVRSGIRILWEVHYDVNSGTYRHPLLKPSTVTCLDMENLQKILNRLRAQVLAMTRIGKDNSLLDFVETRDCLYDTVPGCFSSIAEARDYLEHYSYKAALEGHKVFDTKNAKMCENRTDFIRRYAVLADQWTAAVDKFDQSCGRDLTTKERVGLKILRIHGLKYLMMLEYGKMNMDRTAWDKFNSVFEEIVSLAASVSETLHKTESISVSSSRSPNTSNEGRSRPSFSLDMGIVGPLYDVAALCRDPVIRRRALHVLRLASRQEGVWNSHISAVVAEKVIAIEEIVASGGSFDDLKDGVPFEPFMSDADEHSRPIKSCYEVPESARLSYAHTTLDIVSRKAFLTIGQEERMHMNIPLPGLTTILDLEN